MKKKIIDLLIKISTYDRILFEIINLAKNRIPSYVCFANVHMVIESYWSKYFKDQVNNANLVVADGVPIKLGLKYLYNIYQDRIAGMDMMPSVISECEKENIIIAFYGGSEKTLNAIENIIKTKHPKLSIGCKIIPPYWNLNPNEQQEYIDIINDSQAGVVFVCLGCPKQEKWMADNSNKINSVLLGVGGAFSIYAREKKRAPKWMRSIALEWLFRLFQEPNRMFKRYFLTNNLFLLLMLKEYLVIKILRKKTTNNP